MIEQFAEQIPQDLRRASGAVFYSGRKAFSRPSRLYILGLNPGGDPLTQKAETIERHTRKVLHELPASWSAYRDECWKGPAPGTWGMQPRVLHLLGRLGLLPEEVPASNVVFVRSTRESTFGGKISECAKKCWSFHRSVIEALKPRAVLCLGGTSSKFVRDMLHAREQIDEFVEKNSRKWCSRTFVGNGGIRVVSATHPSRADWTAAATDPSDLVRRALSN